ncbi:type VI secretion system-associated FHA domain protein TagH [Paracoccus sp. Ld10]|uniref:type VI secretion system-associated FHA domain protein TagH n=1 Tax=Paracoccus sp. Ld10 TaxID=649158 RepID=UPI003869B2FA
MTLTLQIENFHMLDDGGPVSVLVPQGGLQVGRRSGMGWVLPDASRYISGHHFDVSHDGVTWWLRDVSTNGTFLQGHRHRLDRPHALSHGDRFQVGQYLIVAIFDLPQSVSALSPGSLPEHRIERVVDEVGQDDPWALGGVAAQPINPLPLSRQGRQPDFSDDFIDLPMAPAPDPGQAVRTSAVAPAQVSPVSPPSGGDGSAVPATSHPVQPMSVPPMRPAPAASGAAFLQGFCDGAGLTPAAAEGVDPQVLGRQLGEALRVSAEQIMAALQDRSTARHFTRSGERTMRGATDNNPLKFLPDGTQALEALFLRPRAGFLTGAAGFDEALGDLRRHQAALFAALQPALIELLADLDPSQIEAEAKPGLTGNRKSRAWDGFVSRWDAKTASENGILDEFIRLFAQAYRKADDRAEHGDTKGRR